MRLRILPPTARERKRYLLVKVDSEAGIEQRELEDAIINAELRFLGELGTANAGLLVISESWNGKTIIIRTNHKLVDETKSALSLIKSIGNKKARLSVIKVSGAIGKLKE